MNNSPARFNSSQNNTRDTRESRVTLTGRLIQTRQGEAIVVKFKVWMFQVNLLVNIPFEGDKMAPVYVQLEPLTTTDLVFPIADEPPG